MEAYPDAAAILARAGWLPHPVHMCYTRGTLVMGLTPDGQSLYVKDWTAIPPGHPLYGPDTPDTAEEAAQWLVTRFQEPTQNETHSPPPAPPEPANTDTGVGAGGDRVGDNAGGSGGEPEHDGGGGDVLVTGGHADLGGDILDAEYADYALELGALPAPADTVVEGEGEIDPLALPEPELADFAPDEIDRTESGPGAFIFGDNLDQMRTAAIGLVVRASRQRQAEYQALMGGHDFAALQGLVLRDTVDGRYVGPQEVYALFVELSQHQNAINRIRYAEAEKVSFLEQANRDEVQAFDPEEDWP